MWRLLEGTKPEADKQHWFVIVKRVVKKLKSAVLAACTEVRGGRTHAAGRMVESAAGPTVGR